MVPMMITFKKYRSLKGKNFLGTLEEATLYETKMKKVYSSYMQLKQKKQRLCDIEEKNIFLSRLYNGYSKQYKDYLNVFYNIENVISFRVYYNTLTQFSIIKEIKQHFSRGIHKSILQSFKEPNIDIKKISSYIKQYHKDNLKSFFFKSLMAEAKFFHRQSSFFKEIEIFNEICGMDYSKVEIEMIIDILYNCIRDDRYTLHGKSEASFRIVNDCVDALIQGDISFGLWGDGDSRINYILGNVNIEYEKVKTLIYKKFKHCSKVIAGVHTLSSYNFENIKYILTKQDYDYMINHVIFLGNNSIKIEAL